MRYLMKVGPLQLKAGKTNAYLLVGPSGMDVAMAASDAVGVQTLKGRAGSGPITCEERLSSAAEKKGLLTGRPPEQALAMKAAFAVTLEHGPLLQKVQNVELILDLIMATVDFERAAPWTDILGDEAIALTVDAPEVTYEGCVMGQLGETFGLAVYDERGSIARMVKLSQHGQQPDGMAFDTMSVVLERESSFVADAVEEWTGVRVAPVLVRIKRGDSAPLNEVEVSTLVACLRAVVSLTRREAGVGACLGVQRKLTVRARMDHAHHLSPVAKPATPDFQKVGRNDPCPCGSGKKYKRCHLSDGGTAPSPAAPLDETHHERDRRLAELLVIWGTDQFGKQAMRAAVTEAFGQREVSAQLVGPLLAYDWTIQGKALSEHFLDARADLPSVDRRWLEAQRSARASVWEVLRIDRGAGFEALNLLTQRRVYVTEVTATLALFPRQALLARVVDLPGGTGAVMCGSHEQPLSPRQADELLQKLREAGPPSSEWAGEVRLLSLWDDAVSRLALKAASPLVVKNTDGDAVLEVEDQFTLTRGAFASVLSSLLKLEGAQVDAEDARGTRLTFTRTGNALHANWKNTVVGSARVTATRLTVATNSERRADELRARVEAAAGSALSHKKRTRKPIPQMKGGEEIMVDAQVSVSPEPVNVMREWLDTVVPALGYRTPRDAANDYAGRRDLHLLLKELELQDAQRPDGLMNTATLRRQLGLDSEGMPVANADLDRALGHGRKVSETLLDFAAPLLDQSQGHHTDAQLRALLEFASLVWNFVALEERGAPAKEVARARAELKPGRVPADVLRHFDDLVARKRSRFAGDLRFFANITVSGQRDGMNVAVQALVPPELIERAKKAGFTP